jgi:hypothetical protein
MHNRTPTQRAAENNQRAAENNQKAFQKAKSKNDKLEHLVEETARLRHDGAPEGSEQGLAF